MRNAESTRRSIRPSRLSRFLRSPLTRFGVPIAAVAAVVVSLAVWTPGATAKTTNSATIWGAAAPSNVALQTTKSGVEVGTRFTVQQSGNATGVRFYKVAGVGGTHTGTLWTSKGRKLATVTFTGESASGWQSARFAQPVALTGGESYVVSYFQPRGRYAATTNITGASASPSLSVTRGAGVYRFTSKSAFPNRVWRNSLYWVDITFTPHGAALRPDGDSTATPTPTPTPTVTPTPTTPPVAQPVPPKPPVVVPPPATKPSTGFPNASNTGVPVGTPLTGYAGPCTITVPGTVIDAKTINCALEIRAKNVVISRSLINGTVYADPDLGIGSFTISDSQVNIGNNPGTGVGDGNFTAIRVHVTGGNRSINCFLNCTVEYSYVHGQFTDSTGVYHESGIRMGSGSVIRGNTIGCTAPDVPPDAGCSAALTGYGDFATVQNNVIDGNLFLGGSGGYCAYGGSTTGKPYSNGVNNIRFTNNVFQRGESGTCGWFGPITSFDTSAPGNVWSGNRFDNGVGVPAAF